MIDRASGVAIWARDTDEIPALGYETNFVLLMVALACYGLFKGWEEALGNHDEGCCFIFGE